MEIVDTNTKRTCVLVLGMHRSGTSAVTRVLNLLGADLPKTLMPPQDTNTAGYWESLAIMDVNDALLAKANSCWDDWTRLDENALSPDDLSAFEAKIAETITTELGDASVIVLKDPRIARLMPIYTRVLRSQGYDIRCVHMTRSPVEVAQSLDRRDKFSTEFSFLLWLRHTLEAEQASRGLDRIFVTYNELMSNDADAVRRMADWGSHFGLSATSATVNKAAGHLQDELRHFLDNEKWLYHCDDVLTGLVARAYLAIKSMSADPLQPDALLILDTSLAELEQYAKISGPAFKDLITKLSAVEDACEARAVEAWAARSENEKLRQENALALTVIQRETEQQRQLHADELALLQSQNETLRQTLSNELSILQGENEFLRKTATKFLRSPLIPLKNSLQYHGARKLAKLLRKYNPAAAQKYARSASKRDPKRFLAPNTSSAAIANADSSLVGQHQTDVSGLPTVILPFGAGFNYARSSARLAVILHVYYFDQAGLFRKAMKNLPVPFSLFVSTDTEEKAEALRKLFRNGPADQTEVRVLPNRGRDIAPKLVGFADIYSRYDLLLYLHTKSSPHDTARLQGWRDHLLNALLGSPETVKSILGAFAEAPRLGMVAPPNLAVIREYMDWSVNYEQSRALAARMGIELTLDSPVAFPAGSMFWARSAAIQPLLNANIELDDFPEEAGQTDATFAHAAERMFFYSCETAGFRWIHAGLSDQLVETDTPIHINSRLDLEWALSDQMPAVLLPGTRPHKKTFPTPEHHLAVAKEAFQNICKQDLAKFFAGQERMIFDDPGDSPQLSIVLILYNQAELTLHCLQSLHKYAGLSVEIIILDNGSTDDTPLLLDCLGGVKIIRSEENLHFLRGVNHAAQHATGKYLLLLNNDTRILPGTIPKALARLEEDTSIGAVGGPIVLLDGTLQEAGSIIFNNGTCLGYGRGRDPGEAEFRFRRDVDYCSGAFLMMRRALWTELGGFDEAFAPAYYEETDLCMRIWETGRRVVYDPDVRIVHFEYASSESSQVAIALQERNLEVFRTKHSVTLLDKHLPLTTPVIRARQRRDSAPRLLVVDDRVPMPNLGAGYPRAAEIFSEIDQAGWSSTLYPIAVPYISCEQAYEAIPVTTELSLGEPFVSLTNFLRQRVSCFDAVLVSRPHNMVRFREAMAQTRGWETVPVLYDAEAIFAERDAALARLGGNRAFDYQKALATELDLARGVQTVFSVSEAEASIFRANGNGDVRVLGHALSPRPLGGGPGQRQNMLFVGALDDDNSPNSDSLVWFVRDIMPRIDAAIGTNWALDVAGRAAARVIHALKSDRVRILGKVENLDALYAKARLFIAPTRYAAGIPMKVHEAASVGLPAVATDLLAQQLGWAHGQHLMSAGDADEFAACCVTLYQDDALWTRLRAGGLDAIRRDCAPKIFRETLHHALRDCLARQNAS